MTRKPDVAVYDCSSGKYYGLVFDKSKWTVAEFREAIEDGYRVILHSDGSFELFDPHNEAA